MHIAQRPEFGESLIIGSTFRPMSHHIIINQDAAVVKFIGSGTRENESPLGRGGVINPTEVRGEFGSRFSSRHPSIVEDAPDVGKMMAILSRDERGVEVAIHR